MLLYWRALRYVMGRMPNVILIVKDIVRILAIVVMIAHWSWIGRWRFTQSLEWSNAGVGGAMQGPRRWQKE
jgi:hypothetical protein